MRTIAIILNCVALFTNIVAFIVINEYFKIINKIDMREMYPPLLTIKGRRAIRKMKRYLKKDKITRSHIHSIYGLAEIEKGKRK